MREKTRCSYRRRMLRERDVDDRLETTSTDAVRAMFDVVQGMPPTEAWLRYLRARHPKAVDLLARAAMTDMAIELLVDVGSVSHDEASTQRAEAAEAAARMLPAHEWTEIRGISQVLEELAEAASADAAVIDLNDGSWRERRRPA
jgi:hypothetical protein